MARREEQGCPAEGWPSGLHDVLSSVYVVDFGLDLQQISTEAEELNHQSVILSCLGISNQ